MADMGPGVTVASFIGDMGHGRGGVKWRRASRGVGRVSGPVGHGTRRSVTFIGAEGAQTVAAALRDFPDLESLKYGPGSTRRATSACGRASQCRGGPSTGAGLARTR